MTAPAPASGSSQQPPLPQLVKELWELIVAYFKQETVVPLQQLGRYVAFGLLGALLLGTGVVFLAMSGLRALQTETGTTFTGNWSWVPYVIVTSPSCSAAPSCGWPAGKRKQQEVSPDDHEGRDVTTDRKITRADIEAKLSSSRARSSAARGTGRARVIAVAVAIVSCRLPARSAARRKRRSAIVEIRRV